MITRLLLTAAFCGAAALMLPGLTQQYMSRPTVPQSGARDDAKVMPASTPATGGREVVLPVDRSGHFRATIEMNGRTVEGLIDTGASTVAINETTARRIGLSPATLDYSIPVSTANGTIKGASALIRRMKIGSISVSDVQGMVLPDEALSGTLVGMSFLGRLSSYGMENGALKLRR